MFQVCPFQILAFLQSEAEIVHHTLENMGFNGLALLCNLLLELSEGLRFVLVYPILQVAPKEEVWGVQVRGMWGPLDGD